MKILMESTSKEAKSDFTSGMNPHQTKNQQEFLDEEGSLDSPPPFPDNTTQHGNIKPEQQDGNKILERIEGTKTPQISIE